MAGSLNRVTLIGNLGADPEVRNTTGGSKVVNFRVATTESWRDKTSGEKKERTEWHSIVVWNEGIAGVAEKYLKKGSKCYVEGELQTRKWQDKDGNDRYSTEVVLTGFGGKLVLLGDGNGSAGGGRAADTNGNADRPGNAASRDIDDQIPF